MKKRGKVGYKSIAKRITGITIGTFGFNWKPLKDKREIISKLIVFLEDRRVLYVPYHMEFGPWVVNSIIEIRKEITETMKQFTDDDPTLQVLETMRAACRKFLQEYDSSKPKIYGFSYEMRLAIYLGEFRAVMGLALAQICSVYKVDVKQELASIFPISDEESKQNKTIKE